MSIKQRLYLGFGLIIALASTQSIFAFYGNWKSTQAVSDIFSGPLVAVDHARSAHTNLLHVKAHVANVMAMTQPVPKDESLQIFDEQYSKFEVNLEAVQSRALSEDANAVMAVLASDAEAWRVAARTLLGDGGGQSIPAPHKLSQLEVQLADSINQLAELTKDDVAALQENMGQAAQLQQIVALVMLLFAIGASIVIGFMTFRALSQPLNRLENTMTRLASDELDVEVTDQDRRDEIGSMARTVEVFKQNALDRINLEERQKENQLAAEKEKQEAIERFVKDFEQNVAIVVSSVSEASAQVDHSANEMVTVAESTSQRSHQVSEASFEAINRVESISALTGELVNSIRAINDQVEECTNFATQAVSQSDRTSSVVSNLADAASSIGEVVELISNIAEQTNLLALNATIEAARAGDAGRGFAVVASEVKSLANQTASATIKISNQIKAMQEKTEASVAEISSISGLIGQISEVSSQIVEAVQEQDHATQNIAQDVQHTTQVMRDITDNISTVSNAATQTGQSAQIVLSASIGLSQHSTKLKQDVEDFVQRVKSA